MEGTRWIQEQKAGPVSSSGAVLGFEDKCSRPLMEAGGQRCARAECSPGGRVGFHCSDSS